MKTIFKHLKPYWGKMAASGFLLILMTLCSLVLPYLMSNIINNGVAKSDTQYVLISGIIMIGVAAVSLAAALINAYVSSRYTVRFIGDLRCRVFDKVVNLSFAEINKFGTGSLLTRSTEDIWVMQDGIGGLLHFVIAVPLMLIGGIVMTFITSGASLAWIILAIAPVIFIAVAMVSSRVHHLWEKADLNIDKQNKLVRERLFGLRVIRSFNKEGGEHERIAGATRNMAGYMIRANILMGVINPIAQMLLNSATVLILYFGSERIQTDTMITAGAIIATLQYISLIINGIMMVSWMFMFIPRLLVAGKRLSDILNLPGASSGVIADERLGGGVRFENISFAYDDAGKNSIEDVTFDIKDGEVAGIIGGTGSGKTTLIKLLLNFFTPNSGKIYIGGRDTSELSTATVRNNISVALQKAALFQGTIEYNIKMGRADATDEHIRQISELAQMKELITGNADGLKHEIKQAGANISGGQKQRVNIARALIKEASVYVFDDSFSALDYLTESKLRRGLNKYLAGKTQIIITQRAATAMRCDKIIVMADGRVVGCGTHKQLLADCQIYKEIYLSQLGGDINNG